MYERMLIASSALFATGSVMAFERWKRERAGRLKAGDIGEDRAAYAIGLAGGKDRIDRILIEAKPGRKASIDHVVKGRNRLIVIETKMWNGTILGKRRERDWVQIRPNGEHVAQRNPVMQSKRQAKVLNELLNVPVAHLVVMAGSAVHGDNAFPEEVIQLGQLKQVLPLLMDGENVAGAAPEDQINKAWERLVNIASSPDAEGKIRRYGENNESKYEKHDWLAWMALAVASCGVAVLAIAAD